MSRRITRSRPALRGVALAISAVVISGAGIGSALAGPSAQPGGAHSPSAVPWSQAGPGWAVAEYSASSALFVTPRFKGPTTLYLTSPKAHKYSFYSWPATTTGQPAYSLVDWSGDRQRVLLQNNLGTKLEQISLVTGKVISKFTLPANVTVIGYTRPNGLNLLAVKGFGSSTQIVRYDLAGRLQVVLARHSGWAVDAPDGTSVIVATGTGLNQVSNGSGRVIRRMRVPVAVTGCTPVRWWNASTVLGICDAKNSAVSRLWLFPVGGGRVTALTPQRNGHGFDLGDIAAWKLTNGLYLQVASACGSEVIGQQYRDGSVHLVNVPGTLNVNNRIVTGVGARLLVKAETGCGGSDSLLWFNPASRSVQWVIHTAHKVSGTQEVVPFGRPLA